ncbi:MAG: NAD(P)/FAD-dependent oxidoreductase [bacterium]
MIDVEATVIGGGMVGCCVAAALAERNVSTVLLEKEARLATGVTARNSEVAHGGMYYPTGSLKAVFCVEGRRLLRQFCQANDIPYQENGKLIVAVTAAEEPELERLLQLGQANGVEDLRLVDGDELSRLEPNIKASAALLSPRTGILDAEGAARAYARLASEHGAEVLTGAEVTGLARAGDGWRVEVGGGNREGWSHSSRWVINAAGLGSDRIAALAGIDIVAAGLELSWVKGNYFAIAPERTGLIQRLIYPVPPADGSSLGIHVCIDLGGQLRLGPDVEPVAVGSDYGVDPARGARFFESASLFLPWLRPDELTPAMAGIRPKLSRDGWGDFYLQRESGDFAGLINLIGIDSPGLTSGPAIARAVADLLQV